MVWKKFFENNIEEISTKPKLIESIDEALCLAISHWLFEHEEEIRKIYDGDVTKLNTRLVATLKFINKDLELWKKPLSSLRKISELVIKKDENLDFIEKELRDDFINKVSEKYIKPKNKENNWPIPKKGERNFPVDEEKKIKALKGIVDEIRNKIANDRISTIEHLYRYLPYKNTYRHKHKFLKYSDIYLIAEGIWKVSITKENPEDNLSKTKILGIFAGEDSVDDKTAIEKKIKKYIDSMSKILFSLDHFSTKKEPASLHFLLIRGVPINNETETNDEIKGSRLDLTAFSKVMKDILNQKSKTNQSTTTNRKIIRSKSGAYNGAKQTIEEFIKTRGHTEFQIATYNWTKGKSFVTRERRLTYKDLVPPESCDDNKMRSLISRQRQLLIDSNWIAAKIKASKKTREEEYIHFTFIFVLRIKKKLLPISKITAERCVNLSKDIEMCLPNFINSRSNEPKINEINKINKIFDDGINLIHKNISSEEPHDLDDNLGIPAIQAFIKNLKTPPCQGDKVCKQRFITLIPIDLTSSVSTDQQ